MYHQALIYIYIETWWYTTPLASQLIRQQVGGGGGFFDVGLLGPCKKHAKDVASMPRTLQSMPRAAEDVAKHA